MMQKPLHHPFAAAAQDTRADDFDFAGEVSALYAALAGKYPRLYFYDLAADTFVYPANPDLAARMTEMVRTSNDHGAQLLRAVMKKTAPQKGAVAMVGAMGMDVVMIYPDPEDTLLGAGISAQMHQTYTFDHEVGHLICRHGHNDSSCLTLGESVADSYAALRHLQRYDGDTTAIEGAKTVRAQRMVSLPGRAQGVHFSCFVTDKLLEMHRRIDVAALDVFQTADMASRLALAFAPNDKIVQQMDVLFAPHRAMMLRQDGSDAPLRHLAQTLLTTDSWEGFRFGAPVLRGYMDGTLLDMPYDGAIVKVPAIDAQDPYWKSVAVRLAAREQAFERDGVFFGLGLPPAPANGNARKAFKPD